MTDNELNSGYVQLALNRMDDAKKHLQIVLTDLQKTTKSSCCEKCNEKQKVIDTLLDTCRLYEARIKRFQTLARQRKNAKRRKVVIPLKSDLEWESDLVYQYGVQVLRDCRYNKHNIDYNAEVSMEVAWASGEIKDKDRRRFKRLIADFARKNKHQTDKLIYEKI